MQITTDFIINIKKLHSAAFSMLFIIKVHNSSCLLLLLPTLCGGKPQNEERKLPASLSRFANEENDDIQFPIKWFDSPKIANSICGLGGSSLWTETYE